MPHKYTNLLNVRPNWLWSTELQKMKIITDDKLNNTQLNGVVLAWLRSSYQSSLLVSSDHCSQV